MEDSTAPLAVLADLEALQDEVLLRLEELDRRVQQVLAQWLSEKRGGAT